MRRAWQVSRIHSHTVISKILSKRRTELLQPLIAGQKIHRHGPAIGDDGERIERGRTLSLQKLRRERLGRVRNGCSILFAPAVTNLDQREMQILGRVVVLPRFEFPEPLLNRRYRLDDLLCRTADEIHTEPEIRPAFRQFLYQQFIDNDARRAQITFTSSLVLLDTPPK